MAHRLDPLLAPRCIAFVGASTRPNTPGNDMVRMAKLGGFAGRLYPINPGYESVEGLRCYPSLAALPETVDHVVLGVANARLEASLDDAIAHGARAVTIFASGVLDADTTPALPERLAARARAADIPICGGNGMGFYNLPLGLRVCGFPSPPDMVPGAITWIAQSGSAFGALAHNDRRPSFNLVVSSGGEWVTTAADYLDWALEQDTTRVAGLFLEAVRDPAGFVAALAKAAARGIPVVVLKVGRTQASAAMAVSHTGAMAGNDAAFAALLDRHGAIRVDTLDEMAATLLLLAHERRLGRGGLAAMHDSGGEREMAVDLAEDLGLRYARIGDATTAKLAPLLDPGLEPMNPLDAWGTGHQFEERFAACMSALLDDDESALGMLFVDLRDGYYLSEGFARAMISAAARSEKPVAIAVNYSLVRHRELALQTTRAGVPVLDGTREALLAARHALAFRDFQQRAAPEPPPTIAADIVATWRSRLSRAQSLTEAEMRDLLAAVGIATPRTIAIDRADAAAEAARRLGFPVVLKSAAGIAHKSDRGGVKVGLRDEGAVAAAYAEMAHRLGPRAVLAEMVGPGVEIGVGAVNDPQFGPFVMVAAGGVLIELLADRAVALAPFGADKAAAMIAKLRVARLLAGMRGMPSANLTALADVVARISALAWALRDVIAEIDVNPVIVMPERAVAVDALIVPRVAAPA